MQYKLVNAKGDINFDSSNVSATILSVIKNNKDIFVPINTPFYQEVPLDKIIVDLGSPGFFTISSESRNSARLSALINETGVIKMGVLGEVWFNNLVDYDVLADLLSDTYLSTVDAPPVNSIMNTKPTLAGMQDRITNRLIGLGFSNTDKWVELPFIRKTPSKAMSLKVDFSVDNAPDAVNSLLYFWVNTLLREGGQALPIDGIKTLTFRLCAKFQSAHIDEFQLIVNDDETSDDFICRRITVCSCDDIFEDVV